MPKFTLIAEHTDLYTGDVTSKTTHEFEVDYLPDALQNMELFLRGVGFVFDGNLDIVNDFEEPPEWHTPQEDFVEHSDFYFDTQRNK
jgi:hypothetical protein